MCGLAKGKGGKNWKIRINIYILLILCIEPEELMRTYFIAEEPISTLC